MGEPASVRMSSAVGLAELNSPQQPARLIEAVAELVLRARNLAECRIKTVGFLMSPDRNSWCRECEMSALNGKLRHAPSCNVGAVLNLIDEICQALTSAEAEEMEEARAEKRASAGTAASPQRGKYGEPWVADRWQWPFQAAMDRDRQSRLTACNGSSPEFDKITLERAVACVNFCDGVPTEVLLREKPIADLGRDLDSMLALRKAIPGLPWFADDRRKAVGA